MKTDQLLATLAADNGVEAPILRGAWRLMAPAAALSLVVLVATLGVRPDYLSAVTAPLVALKTLLPAVVGAGGAAVALRLAQPGRRAGRGASALWAAPVLLALTILYALASNDPAGWPMLMTGKTIFWCVTFIPLLSVPFLAAAFVIARRGAPTDLLRTGAMLGLIAGTFSTAIYSLHCNEDSPLFYGVWYVVGILIVTGAGAILGPRLLRW